MFCPFPPNICLAAPARKFDLVWQRHAPLRLDWWIIHTWVRMLTRLMILPRRLRKSSITLSMRATSSISEGDARWCHLGRARSSCCFITWARSGQQKLAARGAELEPAPQSLSIFRELVQKGFSTTFATKLLRVPPMPNETELSITMGASSCCAPASRCCRNQSSGRRNLQNPAHLNRHRCIRPRNAQAIVPQPASQMCRERAAFPLLN